jgi:hypothetical protein
MAKTKVKLKFDGSLRHFARGSVVDLGLQRELGETVLREMSDRIARGQSPVRGVGRFEGYAGQRLSGSKPRSQLYPFSVRRKFPQKKLRPVNLSLTDKYLDTLSFRPKINGIFFGHYGLSVKQKKMFETHNEGKHSYVPQRKYLPNKRGDRFVVAIESSIREVFAKRISRLTAQT